MDAIHFAIITFLFVWIRGISGQTPTYTVMEEEAVGYRIGNIITQEGLDRKYSMEQLSKLRFSFIVEPKTDIKFIALEEDQGVLKINNKIDREEICPLMERCFLEYDVIVKPGEFFDIIKVTIEIIDKNDNSPVFPEKQIILEIPEATIPGTTFSLPSARDPDGGLNGKLSYTYESDSRKFELQVKDIALGLTDVRLMLVERLDRETKEKYQLKVIATDGGTPPNSGFMEVTVEVGDSNDNAPVFEYGVYEVTIPENKEKGSTITRVYATDLDYGINGEIEYSFAESTKQEFGEMFNIEPITGQIFLRGELDFEQTKMYILTVDALDKGHGSLSSQATVVVRVTDVNDKAPEVSINTLSETGSAEVEENAPIGTFVAHLSVKDDDTGKGGSFACRISSEYFKLVQLTAFEYKIISQAVFDREEKHKYDFPVICTDHGTPSKTSVTTIVVRIADQNDHSPKFQPNSYRISILENRPAGSEIVTVNATDLDAGKNGKIVYSLANEVTNLLRIDDRTGLITTGVLLDFERMQFLEFLVYAEDRGEPPRSATASVYLTILDEDDEMPNFKQQTYSFKITENMPPRTELGIVMATDVDSKPPGEFIYSFDRDRTPEGTFHIDQNSGVITTQRELDRELRPVYHLMVVAHPINNPIQSCSASVEVIVDDVNDQHPYFIFPKAGQNDTVQVPSEAGAGYHVTTLKATDLDIGTNAELMFGITGGDPKKFFSIETFSGKLHVFKSLKGLSGKTFALQVEVTDKGMNQKSDVSILYVSVTDALVVAIAQPKKSFNFLASDTLTVILSCTAGALLVLIMVAVVAVVCVKERRRDRAAHIAAMDAKETEKMLPENQTLEMNGSKANGYNGQTKPPPEVTAVIDMREAKVVSSNNDLYSQPEYRNGSTLPKNSTTTHSSYVKDYVTYGKPPSNGNHYVSQPYNQTQYSRTSSPSRDHYNSLQRQYKGQAPGTGTRTSTVSGEYVHYDHVDSDIL